MARGSHGQEVFQDDRDWQRLLETLGEACARTGFRIHACVLIDGQPLSSAGGDPEREPGGRDEMAAICGLPELTRLCYACRTMSTVQEIEAALPKLSRAEVEEVRAWIDDFLEDQLELKEEVKTKLDQSRREIAEGKYTTRQPK